MKKKLLILTAFILGVFVSNAQLSENFDGGTFPPLDWTMTAGSGSIDQSSQTADHTTGSDMFARYNCYSISGSSPAYLTSPRLVVSSTDKTYSFWVNSYQPSWSGSGSAELYVDVSSDGGSTWTSGTTNYISGQNGNGWLQTILDLTSFESSDFTGNDTYVRFKTISDYGYYNIGIDDVSGPAVHVAACPAPNTLATTNITSTSADLTWVDAAASGAANVEYGITGFTQGTGTMITGTVNTTESVSGLAANTTYDFYVQSDCGTDQSSWAGPFSFTTACAEITSFPFTEDFESSSATRDCWTITDGNSDGDAWNYYNSSSYANSGSYSASIYTDYNSANNDWLISPTLTLSGSKRLKFWTRARSSSEPEEIEVMLSTAGISVSSFTTTLMASTAISNTTYVEYTIDLSSHSGDVNIAFVRRNSPADGYYLYLDDVTVEDIPSCLPPSALATSNLAATSVDLTWTASASAETDWEVVVQADGTGTPVGTGTAVTTTAAHSATGLTAETAYEIYYRANCGGGDFSTWVGPVDFTTPASCLTPTTLTTSNVLSTSADLSWVDAAASGLSNVEYGVTGFSQGTGTMITGTTNTTESISGLTAETTYDFYVQADCGASVSAWAGPTSFYTGYTSPSPSSVDGVGITNVTMGSINNTTVAETNNYGDYSNIITYVAQDAVFPIYITLQTGYTYNLFAWVDWNDDLDFDDADEAFYLGQSTSSNPTTLESSITVPSGVSLGNHRIRIGGADSGLGSTIPSNPNYTGGYASFEDYTLEVVTLASVLPVELIGLSGQTYERNNELTWTTASETNNDYFTIEKSIDGIHYDKIGEVEGNGNSSSIKAYSFNDFEINSILVYYKLTQVDFDGTKEEVGTLKMTRELNNAFSYPNPANDELNFTFNATYDGDIIIEYIDIQGKSISENVTINANRSFKSTVFQTLSSGLYFTRISENGTVIQSMKIVKL